MKRLALLLPIVLVLGCASKPDIIATNQDVVRWCLDHQGDARAEHYYCEELHGYKYIFDGVKPNYDKYDSRNLRESGSISHVTPEQWQAAQDLYYAVICANKTHCEPVVTGPSLDRFPPEHGTTTDENIYVPTGPEKFDTFPPSGDAK